MSGLPQMTFWVATRIATLAHRTKGYFFKMTDDLSFLAVVDIKQLALC